MPSRKGAAKAKKARKLKACQEGYERSKISGRCIPECPPGKKRNPDTGRCINKKTNLPTATTLAGQRRQVFKGRAKRTTGGLKKSDLIENKQGRIVPKKKSEAAKARYIERGNPVRIWNEAVQDARKEMGIKGFVPIKKGTELYKKAVEIALWNENFDYRGQRMN